MTDFKQKLWLTIVDKLVFGSVIFVLGWFANCALETHRQNETLARVISEARIDQIGEIWTRLYKWEFHINKMVGMEIEMERAAASNAEDLAARLGAEIEQMDAESRATYESTPGFVEGSRFWIGKDHYEAFITHYNNIVEYLRVYRERDVVGLDAAKSALEESEADVVDVLDGL